MARNKQTPLKDESEYNVDDLYQKLDEVLQAINNRNLEEAKKLWNLGDADMAKYALALIDFNKAVATAIEAYLKQHQNRFIVDGKLDIPEDVMTLLEKYRQELAEAKEKKRNMCCSVSLPGPIKNRLRRQTISSFFTPMKRSIRKIYKGFGRTGASGWQNKNCDDLSQFLLPSKSALLILLTL